MLRLSPGGEKEKLSDFEGRNPEEVKERNLQRADVRKQNVHQKTCLPGDYKLSNFPIVEPKIDMMPCMSMRTAVLRAGKMITSKEPVGTESWI